MAVDEVSNALISNEYTWSVARCSLSTNHVYPTEGKTFPASAFKLTEKKCFSAVQIGWWESVVVSVLPWHVPLAVWKSAIIRFSAPSVESLVCLVTNLALLFSEKVPSSSCSISSPSMGNDTPNRPIFWVSGEVRAACVAVQVISYCDMVFNVCIEIQICKCWQQTIKIKSG